jgi:hypothetical protein
LRYASPLSDKRHLVQTRLARIIEIAYCPFQGKPGKHRKARFHQKDLSRFRMLKASLIQPMAAELTGAEHGHPFSRGDKNNPSRQRNGAGYGFMQSRF